jgi:hypothetical protein
VFATYHINTHFPLLNDLSNEGGFNAVKRPQKTLGKLVYPHPHCSAFFHLDPGVSGMEIITLRDSKPFDVQHVNRTNNGVHDVLIVKVLIEIAIGAPIIVGACPE